MRCLGGGGGLTADPHSLQALFVLLGGFSVLAAILYAMAGCLVFAADRADDAVQFQPVLV